MKRLVFLVIIETISNDFFLSNKKIETISNDVGQKKDKRLKFNFFFISKLHTHSVGYERKTSPSTMLYREEVPFELELIGTTD